ncbi:hypothetical protein ASD64_00615 [Mesorhizobium sp. Root157]|uniref:hypothetical protein n=1 Tax=Mesorhizobium sp. Root157 TaxID=1736477 RepID=UPI0006FA247D|nr:hypothetical protein [Mesorhizobium sp. Root157]KRA00119.1 hypothetical protein ASD64_00615 [Mesorhizobium sp. Root157]
MENVLPELYQGHAPITLQNAFHDALEAIESWIPGEREPGIFLNGFEIPLIHVVGAMSRCTDLLPRRSRSVLEAIAGARTGIAEGSTFADGAILAMPICRERLQSLRIWPAIQASRDLECAANAYGGA